MNADTLVNLLLEYLEIINPKDIDLELNRLAASIIDPRAKVWFKRVPRYWLFNIDKLQDPYEAPAVARDVRRGSKYYHEPGSRAELLWPAWRGEQPVGKPNVCEKCKGEKGTFNKETGEWRRCRVCGGTGLAEKPYAGSEPCPKCGGSGQVKPGPEGAVIPARRGEGGATTCDACGGTGLPKEKIKKRKSAGREGFFVGEALVRWLIGEADEPEPDLPGYDPQKQTYTTKLHVQPEIIECPDCGGTGKQGAQVCPRCKGHKTTQQRVAKDIQQSFTRFHPSKATAKQPYAGPPSKKNVKPWMTDPNKEFYYFDPIQVKQRDLFSRLVNLVHFLNFSSQALTRPAALTPDEVEGMDAEEGMAVIAQRRKQNEEANALFDQLKAMKTDDVAGFRDVMLKAEEFQYNVKHHPEMFGIKSSGRVLARRGHLVLRKCDDFESAIACGRKEPYNQIRRTWCLQNDYNVKGYVADGPLFYVERDGLAYVGIHPATTQVKDPQNQEIERSLSAEDAEAIAPLLVPFAVDIPERALQREARHLADTVGALRHEKGIH